MSIYVPWGWPSTLMSNFNRPTAFNGEIRTHKFNTGAPNIFFDDTLLDVIPVPSRNRRERRFLRSTLWLAQISKSDKYDTWTWSYFSNKVPKFTRGKNYIVKERICAILFTFFYPWNRSGWIDVLWKIYVPPYPLLICRVQTTNVTPNVFYVFFWLTYLSEYSKQFSAGPVVSRMRAEMGRPDGIAKLSGTSHRGGMEWISFYEKILLVCAVRIAYSRKRVFRRRCLTPDISRPGPPARRRLYMAAVGSWPLPWAEEKGLSSGGPPEAPEQHKFELHSWVSIVVVDHNSGISAGWSVMCKFIYQLRQRPSCDCSFQLSAINSGQYWPFLWCHRSSKYVQLAIPRSLLWSLCLSNSILLGRFILHYKQLASL